MSLYDLNMDFFKKASPAIYNMLKGEEPIYDLGIVVLEEPLNYLIEYDGVKKYVHSKFNIENEMKISTKEIVETDDIAIIFGLGGGHILEYIHQNHKNIKRILIIEPSLHIFKETLKRIDVLELTKGKQISFVVNKDIDTTTLYIEDFFTDISEFKLICNNTYRTIFEQFYSGISRNLLQVIRKKTQNINITSIMSNMWLINSLKNFEQESIPIENIIDLFKDKTAVIVSAGPSLNKNMHLLNSIKDKAILIAVGTSIKILDSNNIIPHFRMAFDGNPLEMKVVDGINTSSAPLLYGGKLYYEVLPEYEGDKYRMNIWGDYLTDYVYDKMNLEYKKIASTPTIASTALEFLCNIGCKRVIFVGQDLCFQADAEYAEGAGNREPGGLTNLREARDIYGNKVTTRHDFLSVKYLMEECIRCFSEIEFINATEGGLGIHGSQNMKLVDVINEKLILEPNLNIETILNEKKSLYDFEDFKIKRQKAFKDIVKQLIQVSEIINEIIDLLKKSDKNKKRNLGINRLISDIDYIEKKYLELKDIEIFKNEIELSLKDVLKTVDELYQYKGNDNYKKMESREKILLGKIEKITEYVNIYFDVIEVD